MSDMWTQASAPPPGASPTSFEPAAPSATPLPATAEMRKEEVGRLMADPRYLSDHAHERGPLVRRVRELLDADHPTDTRPRDAVTGMVEAEPEQAPPASRMDLDAALGNHITFPATVSDDDRTLFRATARDGLAALGASPAEAGWFTVAASEVLKAPDAFTPETAAATLQREWGASFDANLRAARGAMQRLPQHVRAHLAEHPIGNHPSVVKLLADAGRRLGLAR
jgi:hypothetical protein